MAKKTNGQSKKGMTGAQKVSLGVGLTAAAAAAAGAYFLYGSKNAPKNRKIVKSWLLKAKAEVLEALEQAGHMTQMEYEQLVDGIAKAYGMMKNVTKGEIADFRKEMKSHWSQIAKSGVVKQAVKKVAGQAAKKAGAPARKQGAKKAAKKTAAKKAS